MAKIRLSNLLVLAFLFVCFTACNKAEQKTEQKTIQHNISVKVAIIYNLGGAQEVAREDFYLLNKDAVQIWKEGGLMNDMKIGGKIKKGEELFKIYFLIDRLLVAERKPSKFGEALKPYIVKIVTTDFEGNATFESVPEGNYYIYGATETRGGGYAVWNYQVSTNETKTVLLDNKNAIYSS